MLVYLNLILVALNMIHKSLGSDRGLYNCINIIFIVTDHSIVMLSKFLQILFVDLYFSFDVLFTLSLL